MRYLLLFLVALSELGKAHGQNLPPKDSVSIISVINDWDKAWATKDYALAARGYSDDARFTNAFGDKRTGQKEVHGLLKEVFSLPFVMSGSSQTAEHRLQVLDSTTVLVHTAVIRKGQQMPDGSVIADRQTTHLRVFRKKGDKWSIKGHLISDARDKQSSRH